MSPRSPHVNMRVSSASHEHLTKLAIELSAELGRRLSIAEVHDAAIATADRDKMSVALKGRPATR